MAATFLIVGLGNPGRAYAETRHNVGFMVVDDIASRERIDLSRRRAHAYYGQGTLAGAPVVLAKPQTFMNDSGQAVRGLMDWFKIDLSAVIVVYDERDLPVGRVRVRPGGSAAGHNGIKSVMQHVGSPDFTRVRIGIGRPPGEAIGHVLSRFTNDERPLIVGAIERARLAIGTVVVDRVEAAMNRFNGLE
jgi:peptidyl-tRNA hydrolase, PTH1 family